MDPNALRDFVNKEVDPPAKGKPMTLSKELSNEIASAIPFWAPLLRDRDIRGTDGGDEYVTGLIEAFSRVYSALKNHGAQTVLGVLDLDTLYNLDAELQSSDLGLLDEYPALEMASVKQMESFGAGILMAYALFETAIAVAGGNAPKTAPAVQKEAPEPVTGLMEDLMAGLPEEETSKTAQSATTPPDFTLNQKGPVSPSFLNWNFDNEHARTSIAPLMVLGVFPEKDGIVVRGELPHSLGGIAQAHQIVSALFGVDASVYMGQRGPEFAIRYPTKGGRS